MGPNRGRVQSFAAKHLSSGVFLLVKTSTTAPLSLDLVRISAKTLTLEIDFKQQLLLISVSP